MTEKIKILIIDDNKDLLETLSDVLHEKGYVTETAETGKEALTKAEESFFNIALVDLNLPDVMGTELIQNLKKQFPRLIIIVITGYATLQNAINALNLGVNAFVIKPLDIDKVEAMIKKFIKYDARIPSVNIIDSEKEYIVKAELPGIKKEKVELQLGMNLMWMFAKGDADADETGKAYLRKEIASPVFQRYIGFVEGVDIAQVTAHMSDGVLKVTLPKLGTEFERKSARALARQGLEEQLREVHVHQFRVKRANK